MRIAGACGITSDLSFVFYTADYEWLKLHGRLKLRPADISVLTIEAEIAYY